MLKLLEVGKSYLAIVGVAPLQPGQNSVFNIRNVSVTLTFASGSILTCAFLFFEASTIEEYTEAFFAWVTVTSIAIGFLLNTIRSPRSFQYIENIEQIIENGK